MTSRNRALDGLRGIAALLVILAHGWPSLFETWSPTFKPGPIGVRLFFLLSSSLIAVLLFRDRQEADDLGASHWSVWWRFAARRALRILPLAYLAMFVAWLDHMPAVAPEHRWWAVTFTQNIRMAVLGQPTDAWPPGLSHFWTLNFEEQLYLLWPLLILALPARMWPWLMASMLFVGPWYRLYVANLLPFRDFDVFALGGLIGWAVVRGYRLRPWLMAVIGVAMLGSALWLGDGVDAWWFGTGVLLQSETGMILLASALVAFAWTNPTQTVMSWQPLVWCGTISFGLYVWHPLISTVVQDLGWIAIPSTGVVRLGWFTLCGFIPATLTWYLYERPILSLKDRLSPLRPRRQVEAAAELRPA